LKIAEMQTLLRMKTNDKFAHFCHFTATIDINTRS